MKLPNLPLAWTLMAVCWSSAAWSQVRTEPPPQPAPELPAAAPPPEAAKPPAAAPPPEAAKPPQAAKGAGIVPSTADVQALTTGDASAAIVGDPQKALATARRDIKADPRDPWPHYVEGAALTLIGQTDAALKSFAAAEERFPVSDIWARSIAIYGRAHALAEARRCEQARTEFLHYAAFVREREPKSAAMAIRYAADCRTPTPVEPQR